MKKYVIIITGIFLFWGYLLPDIYGQNHIKTIREYFKKLPEGMGENTVVPQKYKMTAIYTNRDLYGNFTDKTEVSGDYTRGLENGFVTWNNVSIAKADAQSVPFPKGVKQDYMENIRYIPSSGILNEEVFHDFPSGPDNVLARNLIWDMIAIEIFAWKYTDSLKFNRIYSIPDTSGKFNMGEIGSYEHSNIQLRWTGISEVNEKLCAIIEFRAMDNKVELSLDQMNSKGTEQYWGSTWISLDDRQIEYAEMYSITVQEIEIKAFGNKFITNTKRELLVKRIY